MWHRLRRRINRRKKAVTPVLATLLVIAVGVSLSVMLFIWSQGFLSQNSESISSQQGAQNQVAQSSIVLEAVTFSDTIATVYFRNGGAVAITPALLAAQGISSNYGFTGTATNSTNLTSGSLANGVGGSNAMTLSGLASGDVVAFKITSTAGTFAQGTYTVP